MCFAVVCMEGLFSQIRSHFCYIYFIQEKDTVGNRNWGVCNSVWCLCKGRIFVSITLLTVVISMTTIENKDIC